MTEREFKKRASEFKERLSLVGLNSVGLCYHISRYFGVEAKSCFFFEYFMADCASVNQQEPAYYEDIVVIKEYRDFRALTFLFWEQVVLDEKLYLKF